MKNISLWQYAGFAVTSILATLLHFVYDWTNKSVLVCPFSAINESTWEHMKLLFWPMFVFAMIQSLFFKEYKSFWCVKLIGILTGLVLIPTLFYTLNGILGKTPDWVNIAIFFVAAAVADIMETVLFKNDTVRCRYPWLAFLGICAVAVLFVVFTFYPPDLPIFVSP